MTTPKKPVADKIENVTVDRVELSSTGRIGAIASAAVLIIGSIATAAVLVINALGDTKDAVKAVSAQAVQVSAEAAKAAENQDVQLREIHLQVNSNLKELQDRLTVALAELARVSSELATLTKRQDDIDAAIKARQASESQPQP